MQVDAPVDFPLLRIRSSRACAPKHTHPNHFWPKDFLKSEFLQKCIFALGRNLKDDIPERFLRQQKLCGWGEFFWESKKPAFAGREGSEGSGGGELSFDQI